MIRRFALVLLVVAGALAACNPPPPAADPGKAASEAQCNVPPDPSKTPPCPLGCKLDNGACVPDRGPPVHN